MSAPKRGLPWTAPGSHLRTRGEPERAGPAAEARTTIWTALHLDDITKVLALSGGLLYGVLFMAYRAYYDPIDLSPEDVGVDTVYVLVRTPGFVLLTLVALGIALSIDKAGGSGFRVIERTDASPSELRRVMPRVVSFIMLASPALASYISQFVLEIDRDDSTPGLVAKIGTGITATILILSAVAMFLRMSSHPVAARFVRLVGVSVIAVLIPGVLLLNEAGELGNFAAKGYPTQPVTVFGIVVLDVSAPAVNVLWADAKTPHPAYFGKTDAPQLAQGLLLGQTDTSIVVNFGNHRPQIVRFDARQVIIEFTEAKPVN